MKYFNFIDNKHNIFYREPMEFNMFSDKELLSYSLGATLYMSGLRKNLLNDIEASLGCSVVVCLEDAVASDKLNIAEKNVLNLFRSIENIIKADPDFLYTLPLIFLRVRNCEQLQFFLNNSSLSGLSGFVFPKFDTLTGLKYLKCLKQYNIMNNKSLYALPILETQGVIYKESRIDELLAIKRLIDEFRELILALRIAGTDFSGLYGLRRDRNTTIYDLTVIRDCISDIINIFKIDDYIISAPVNEYFNFPEGYENSSFTREVFLDRANGLIGKTVIHPSQVNVVNSIMTISKEEYLDAKSIIASSEDGVIKSIYSNKMNEVKPHLKWAKHIILLSKLLGVLNNGKDYRDLLSLSGNKIYRQELEGSSKY